MKLLVVLIMLLNINFLLFSQESGYGSLKFAYFLLETKDYYRAISEFKRLYFFATDKENKKKYIYLIAYSYAKAKKWDAVYFYASQLKDKLSANLSFWSYFMLNRFDKAHFDFNDPFHREVYNIYFKNYDKIEFLKEKYKAYGRKNPYMAGILGIVPGLGYVYTGLYNKFFLTVLWTGALGYSSYDFYRHDLYGPAALFGIATLLWYAGSIYGAVNSAHRYNEDIYKNLYDEWADKRKKLMEEYFIKLPYISH